MFGRLKLDDETFEEILEYNKKKISQINETWTDFNEHDPGITFLELLSWMKEMQQFHLDQIGEENEKMFLKLIGMKQRKKKPVQTFAILDQIERAFYLPKNSRIYARDLLFETVEERHIIPNHLVSIWSNLEKKRGKGAQIRLYFAQAFSEGEAYKLWIQLTELKEKKRPPMREGFFPLIHWRLEAWKEGIGIPCQILQDETYGLLYSGEITFVLLNRSLSVEQPELKHETNFLLQFTIEDGEYEIPPSIQSVECNSVFVQQTETYITYEKVTVMEDRKTLFLNSRLAYYGGFEIYRKEDTIWYPVEVEGREILANGVQIRLKAASIGEMVFYVVLYERGFEAERNFIMDGFPYQKIVLDNTELLQDGVEVIAEHPIRKGCFEFYNRVEDFHNSGPEDRHFVLDEEQGVLYFGDCERGMAPKGKLKLIRFVTSKGVKGNIKKHQLRDFEDGTIPAKVRNEEDTSGGADKEGVEECFKRFLIERRQVERAVTMKDYEELVKHTPGLLVHKVRATTCFQTEGHTVTIVVKPYSFEPRPVLNKGYERNILRMLEPRRILGTRIQIVSPEYIGISLFAELVYKSHYKGVKELVETAIQKYFQEKLLEFGKTLIYGEIYGVLEKLDCIEEVKALSIHASGKGVFRKPNGDYLLAENVLGYLEHMKFEFRKKEG